MSTWQEENVYCSEPVFLPRPGTDLAEDDGVRIHIISYHDLIFHTKVLIFSIIWGKPHVTWTGIVFLDAR